jgi:plasmid maintenance system antidote protein VapI
MKTAAEYLDAIKAKHHLPSDYAAAKLIGTTRSAISLHRNGHTHFGPDVAIRVAALLQIDEEIVLLDAAFSQAQSDPERNAWQRVIKRLGGVAATVAVAATLTGAPAPASAFQPSQATLFIMSTCRRTFAALAKALGIRPLSVVF